MFAFLLFCSKLGRYTVGVAYFIKIQHEIFKKKIYNWYRPQEVPKSVLSKIFEPL